MKPFDKEFPSRERGERKLARPFSVEVSIPLVVADLAKWQAKDAAVKKIADKFRGRLWASGAGFGGRDLSFAFYTRDDAAKFGRAVKTWSKHVTLLLFDYSQYDPCSEKEGAK